MKQKKILLSVFSIILFLIAVFAFGSCKSETGSQDMPSGGVEKIEVDKNGELFILYTDGNLQKVEIPKGKEHTHAFGDWILMSGRDCESRLEYKQCADCNEIVFKKGKYEDHEFQIESIAPTCTIKGYDKKICGKCGKEEINNYTAIIEHKWETQYRYDAIRHWLKCADCEAKSAQGNHSDNGFGQCIICNQSIFKIDLSECKVNIENISTLEIKKYNDGESDNYKNYLVSSISQNDDIEVKVDFTGKNGAKITQDDLNAEVDKVCITNEFTFISFVPIYTSQRPIDNQLVMDLDGKYIYDKSGYFESDTRKSFVIDNKTGLIYKIGNVIIDNIKNGLCTIDGQICDLKITEEGALEFFSVVQNQELTVYDYYKDIYGNKYIYNDSLDLLDKESQTVYYHQQNSYVFSDEGVAIYFEYTGVISGSGPVDITFKTVEKIGEEFAKEIIDKQDTYHFAYKLYNDGNELLSSMVLSHIEDGYLYYYSEAGYAFSHYYKINIKTLEREYKQYGTYANYWTYDCAYSAPIDFETVLVWSDLSGVSTLYYGKVWGDNAYLGGTDLTNLIVLLEDCEIISWNTQDFRKVYCRKTTRTETIYYCVIINEIGTPTIIEIDKNSIY